MSKNKIYVVTMYRYGNKQNDSYVLGAFSKKQKAFDEADAEEAYRGGKYSGEVLEFNPNESIRITEKAKIVRVVKLHPELGSIPRGAL
jgi:hypothetical protein